MADKITPRSQDFSRWYQDIVLQSQMADYSPVKGCMVIRPNGYSVWEAIQRELDARIKATGVSNAYFPVFIPESFLKKEAEHVEGFAPQCAVVTYAGAKDLEEKLVVRPTSETIINSMFAKWIQSYRDLPLQINQWANVVRWEMRTRLFLRTTEFLWQEGHTCHATAEESEAKTIEMLKVYQEFSEEVLAMPVIAGLKTESEKFAGALRTYCIEAMMQDKKALQAGTSHNLSTHFAEAFETKYLGKDGKESSVHQTSWGVSTRLIGGLIMTHSDDKGLVLPPRVARTHIRIIPIGRNADARAKVIEKAESIRKEILTCEAATKLPYSVSVDIDDDENKSPGWKFHEAELIGIPIRIELGPKDLEKGTAVVVRRDQGEKKFVEFGNIAALVCDELDQMQKDLLDKAKAFRAENTFEPKTQEEFIEKALEGFVIAPWCNDADEEKKLNEKKITVRCILLDDQHQPIQPSASECLHTGKPAKVQAVFARSY